MRARRPATLLTVLTLLFAPGWLGCDNPSDSNERTLALDDHQLTVDWAVSRTQEDNCGGAGVAGASVTGSGRLTNLGVSSITISAAWDVAHLITGQAQHDPEGPASGPVAPVLGRSRYPYAFRHNPSTGNCGQGASATGKAILTASNGDKVLGDVVGGETHKLDFILDGDGVEVFADVEVTGGTGRYDGATGSFVVHAIARLMPTMRFSLTLVDVLPGAKITY